MRLLASTPVAFAFYKLLKLWAAGRHSDFEGLNPSSLFLSVAGLEGRLDRTKTSGPGRRSGFFHFRETQSVLGKT